MAGGPLAPGKHRHVMRSDEQYEPSTKFAVRSIWGSVRLRASYSFAPVERGTRVLSVAELAMGGFFGVVAPLLSGVIQRQHAKDLRTLRRSSSRSRQLAREEHGDHHRSTER